MVKKSKKQATYAMQEDGPAIGPVSKTADMDIEGPAKHGLGVQKTSLKPKPAKRGQRTAKQQQRKQMKLDKALGFSDRKQTKAVKLSNSKSKKQHAKGLWSGSKEWPNFRDD